MKKILLIGVILIATTFLIGCTGLIPPSPPQPPDYDRIWDLEGTWMANENNIVTIIVEDEYGGKILLDTEFFNGASPPNDGSWHTIMFDIFCGGSPPFDETPFCIAEEIEEGTWTCIYDMEIKWIDKNTILIDETDRYPKNLEFTRIN